MKIKLDLFSTIRYILPPVLASCLTVFPVRAPAQNTAVSAADFQRLVYSAHLHSELALKPELEASLQVLLELHRRNPQADPVGLVGVVNNALQIYRSTGPYYLRTSGSQDEILAAYLDAFRQVPKPVNFVQVNLAMLNNFTLGPDDYSMGTSRGLKAGNLIYLLADWGQQHLFSTRTATAKRQELVDDCISRAQSHTGFAAALDGLVLPETGVSLADTPAQILGNANSPLHDNLTMTNLLALSQASTDGSLSISSNLVINLFTNQMQTFWDTIHTNLAVLSQINQSQPDLLAYLTNQTAMDANAQLLAAVQQGQPAKLASATAAILVQSKLLDITEPQTSKAEQAIEAASAGADIGTGLAELVCEGSPKGLESIKSGVLSLFNMFSGTQSHQEQVEDQMVDEIKNTQTLIGDLSQNTEYRFDRVDQSLTTIFDTLNSQFANINYTLGAQGQQIAQITKGVDAIRGSLVGVQTTLDRLEQEVVLGFQTTERNEHLIGPANDALFFSLQNPGKTLSWPDYGQGNGNYEGTFASFVTTYAQDDNLSPNSFGAGDFSGVFLQQRLANFPLDANLNYIKQFLANPPLGQTTGGSLPLSNPRDWFAGAYALVQLDAENPMLFRQKTAGDVTNAIVKGWELTNFLGSLTFSGNGVNLGLYTALKNYYLNKLNSFNARVSDAEQDYATSTNFDLGTWRQWDMAAPRILATNTAVLAVTPKNLIAAGNSFSLALKPNGRVVGWGDNTYGQTTIPASTTNVVAIGAGEWHSLALRADGRVIGWGDNSYGQINIPPGLINVVAIAAGGHSSLALQADGTIIGWGDNSFGQTNVPSGLTNVVAIAAGFYHTLALRADGQVLGWGRNYEGQTTIPVSATNVVAIAAGANHSLALKADGQALVWGNNNYGQATLPTALSNVAAIAGGRWHSLAVKADGTVVGWGQGNPATAGSALSFDGTSSYVELNRPVQDDFTIEFWFRSTQVTGGETQWWQGMGLLDGEVAGNANDFGVSFGNGKVLFGTGNPDTTIRSGALADGQWHHVAATRQKATGALNLFVDGVPNPTATGSQNSLTAPTKLRLGSLQTALNFFQGQIDEVRIWNVARSQSEIQANMNASLNGTEPNLAVYYRLNEGSGSIADDASTNHLDGTLHSPAWVSSSMPSWGQATPPSGLGNVVGIAAGGGHSLALKADGSIIGWGDNQAGQAIAPIWMASAPARTHLAAGYEHGLTLKADGTVFAWGDDSSGQVSGVPSSASPYLASNTVALGGQMLSNVVAVSASGFHSLALKANGSVVGWGDNQYSQSTVPADVSNTVAVAAGYGHCLALKRNGTVSGWGWNAFGQSSIPSGLTDVVAIAAGDYHSLALKANGRVVAWGAGLVSSSEPNLGQSAVPTYLDNVVAIAAGSYHSLALKADGTVVGWGAGGPGASGFWDHGETTIPAGLSNVVAIAAGHYYSMALKADGTVVGWGNGDSGPASLSNVVAIAGGWNRFGLALKADGTVVGWNSPCAVPAEVFDLAASGESPLGLCAIPPVSSPITAVAAGSAHCLALTAGGSAIAWGLNTWGQTNVPLPAQSAVQAVSAGFGHSLALLTNGSVLAWGLSDCSQANVPTLAQRSVVAISAGGKNSLALRSDGTVVAWGLDNYGQVSSIPTLVNGQMVQGNVVAISAGGEHCLALTANGMVAGWGNDTDRQTDVPTLARTNVVAIAAGRYHSLALTSAGQVLAWGLNSSGQCDVPPAAQSGVVAIAAGNTHSGALKTDGTIVVWGSGPAAFTPPQTWNNGVAIALGDQHSLFLTANAVAGASSLQGLPFISAQIPGRLAPLFAGANNYLTNQLALAGPLRDACTELSGGKSLLAAVLELGMPYTLQSDGILHGFVYGSESLLDQGTVPFALQTMNSNLLANPQARPPVLSDVGTLRYARFADRLSQCLTNLHEPEIPRLVGHTLRLLYLLRDASTSPPPPALELSSVSNSPSLLLYGEPYVQYTLQYRDTLSAPGWTTTSITNLLDAQSITPPVSGSPQRFYRALLPMP